jgi:hypothetical protein
MPPAKRVLEGRRIGIAQEERHLLHRKSGVEIALRALPPHGVHDLAQARALIGEPAGQRPRAARQGARHERGAEAALVQQPTDGGVDLGLHRTGRGCRPGELHAECPVDVAEQGRIRAGETAVHDAGRERHLGPGRAIRRLHTQDGREPLVVAAGRVLERH